MSATCCGRRGRLLIAGAPSSVSPVLRSRATTSGVPPRIARLVCAALALEPSVEISNENALPASSDHEDRQNAGIPRLAQALDVDAIPLRRLGQRRELALSRA